MRVRCGMNVNLSFSQRLSLEPDSVLTSKQGKQSRDADTNNKKERLQKQTSSAVVQSTVFTSH